MTQVKMGEGNVIFSNLGPIRGQYVFFTTLSYDFWCLSLILLKKIMLSG